MMLKRKKPPVNTPVLIGIDTATVTFATEGERKDAQETAVAVAAMLSLTRGVTAAEQHTGCKAIRADFNSEDEVSASIRDRQESVCRAGVHRRGERLDFGGQRNINQKQGANEEDKDWHNPFPIQE